MAYESYIAGYRQRRSEMRQAHERERTALLERIRSLRDYFGSLAGVQRVYVFGSAATPGRFRAASDVDLAFEGLSAESFCRVLSELVDRLERSVDAVRLEDASEPLRERVMKGLVVYERGTRQDS